MRPKLKLALAGGVGAAALAALAFVPGQFALSADHLDPPMRTDPAVNSRADVGADIADIYTFHDANFLYILDTVGGPSDPSLPAFYDRDLLHTINISTSKPTASSDITIRVRFGPGANPGEFGVSVENAPGVNGAIVGPVERVLTKDGMMVYAGLRDDPFFFDSQGLRESRTMGTIRFNNMRSFFHGKNITVIALAIPRSRLPANTTLDIWATSARFGGLLS